MACRSPVTSLETLADRIWAGSRGARRIIGVAGPPGAGKTTLAQSLIRRLRERDVDLVTAHVPGDGFHLADAELARLGRLARKGAPDTFDASGYAALLARLLDSGSPGTVYAPAFDRNIEQPIAGAIPVAPWCDLIFTECNYLLLEEEPWPAVRRCLDEVWFVEVDEGVRRRRLVERHVRFGKTRAAAEAWVRDVDEPNARLVGTTRLRADLLVAGTALTAQ